MADNIESSDSSGSERTGENTPKQDSNSSNDNSASYANVFKNDGSFLELFKKKLEEEKRRKQASPSTAAASGTSTDTSTSSHTSSGDVVVETSNKHDKLSSATTNSSKIDRLKDDSSNAETSEKSDESKPQKTAAKKKYSLLSHVGKRPGGKLTLKTGQVKKPKQSDQDSEPKDAWSKYMSEVEKYKAHVCSDDDDKVRPLVK